MEAAYKTVCQLVADFKAHESKYLSHSYSEQHVRLDYINKFFAALGWDVDHKSQKNPFEQEVRIENTVQVGKSQKKADYAFYLAPQYRDPQFFVEAKKPSKNLFNPADYYQTIRYGWNANTPIAVLTDFEEFHIIDCRYMPHIENATSHKIKIFHYSEYSDPEQFALIYWLFSREAVANGSIEKRASELPKPKGKAIQESLFKGAYKPVDEAFLEQLDVYREILAKSFKKANPNLGSEILTEAVQRTIDRLVFIRFLEDKQIENEEITHLRDQKSAWQAFLGLCQRLKPKYNGLVFEPHRIIDSPSFNPPDDTQFVNICDDLSDNTSPYNFDQIPISILGNVYERFLGKVIHATEKRVRIEDKPEVQQVGGVFYTPEPVVRYIVQETVGKAIEGKTPDEISHMTFGDIACGSGSFLIEVFDQLLIYHLKYYSENPKKASKDAIFHHNERSYLTLKKKKEILINNIFGIDIDYQAIEVTQLSLYLKLLEEATMQDAFQFALLKEKILPDLSKNIICGNSLIDSDYLHHEAFSAEDNVLPLEIKEIFPKIHERNGFDIIVGNPPYVLLQILQQRSVFEYLAAKYQSAKYKIDTYQVFLERALSLVISCGMVGYIIPNTFIRNKYAKDLRTYILKHSNVAILRLFYYQVFRQASVDTAILILSRTDSPNPENAVKVVQSIDPREEGKTHTQRQQVWINHPNHDFGICEDEALLVINDKIVKQSIPLGAFATAYFGIQTFGREKYVSTKANSKFYRPVIDGENINRYSLTPPKEYVDTEPKAIKSGGNKTVYESERVGVRQIGKVPVATYLPPGIYTLNTIYNIYIVKRTDYSIRFVLAVICSRVLVWFWTKNMFDEKETFPKIKKEALLSIPIPIIDFNNEDQKAMHNQIVGCVDNILSIREKMGGMITEAKYSQYEMLCREFERDIDLKLYKLYNLSEEEIAIIEQSRI